jgi:hypothetical protein
MIEINEQTTTKVEYPFISFKTLQGILVVLLGQTSPTRNVQLRIQCQNEPNVIKAEE